MFPDISECKKNVILSVLSNVSVPNGLYFEQLWYVDHPNVLYNMCKAIKEVSVPKVGRMTRGDHYNITDGRPINLD